MTTSFKVLRASAFALVFGFGFGLLAGACSSGDAGTASVPFDPFGTETATGGEPAGGGGETPPNSGASIEQLCARACANIAASCPTYSDTDCVSGCASVPSQIPQCTDEFKSYVACVGTASLTCDEYGPNTAVACNASEQAFSYCVNEY
jgi:hypothetical protein